MVLKLKVAGHLSGTPFRNVRGRLCPWHRLPSRGVSTPFQLTVDEIQQRLGRLRQVVGIRRTQLVAVDEDVTDSFQLAGGHQRPAMEELPDGYGSQEGVGFVGSAMVAMVLGCSSSSNTGRGGCDTMGQENLGLE
ncbi:hypothetical protein ACX800_14610 [Paenarthrobacter nitroguajacolicus]|uniref:hypothetical protein n=1 Tax=Paenarthrobacter nitroguajacolicus TaxID=211146 RepID=UPI003D21872B